MLVYCTGKLTEENKKGGVPTANAVRLSAGDGDQLTVTELWSLPLTGGPQSGVIVGNRFYLPVTGGRPVAGELRPGKNDAHDLIIDLESGEVVGKTLFGSDHHRVLSAGDRLFVLGSIRTGQGICRVFDLDGKQLAENLLESAKQTPNVGNRFVNTAALTAGTTATTTAVSTPCHALLARASTSVRVTN